MTKAEARRIAWRIAASWVDSDVDGDCLERALDARDITKESDREKIAKAMREVIERMEDRAYDHVTKTEA